MGWIDDHSANREGYVAGGGYAGRDMGLHIYRRCSGSLSQHSFSRGGGYRRVNSGNISLDGMR
nr:hypothetical protein [Mesorhizobium sp. BAC0120]